MAQALLAAPPSDRERVERTVALIARRGYAVPAARLGRLCWGGPLTEGRVLAVAQASPNLSLECGLVVARDLRPGAGAIAARASQHERSAPAYLEMARRFVRRLVSLCPSVLAVSVAGSLASGGFRPSDDVDLNLVVEDGHRHIAYVMLNFLGVLHAMPRRSKPVDAHTRRPIAPRLMTANLILERSQCFPLARQDEDMAYELLAAEPMFGLGMWRAVVAGNPGLVECFPQLGEIQGSAVITPTPRLPAALQPSWLDPAARSLGGWGWRYMQWSRRHSPEALARVEYVRRTMRPYALFDSE